MNTNLKFYKKSRRKNNVGDVFIISPNESVDLLCLIVDNSVQNPLLIEGMISIIIFHRNVKRQNCDKPSILDIINNSSLLTPPIITNRLGWTKGYFKTIENTDINYTDIIHPSEITFYYSLNQIFTLTGTSNELSNFSFTGVSSVKSYLAIEVLIQISLDLEFVEPPPKKYNPYGYYDELKAEYPNLELPFWYYKAKKRLGLE